MLIRRQNYSKSLTRHLSHHVYMCVCISHWFAYLVAPPQGDKYLIRRMYYLEFFLFVLLFNNQACIKCNGTSTWEIIILHICIWLEIRVKKKTKKTAKSISTGLEIENPTRGICLLTKIESAFIFLIWKITFDQSVLHH